MADAIAGDIIRRINKKKNEDLLITSKFVGKNGPKEKEKEYS